MIRPKGLLWITAPSYHLPKSGSMGYNGGVAEISFLKKFSLPKFTLEFLHGKPDRIVGIDIGSFSTKVVQLRYSEERAILETYGELLNQGYLKTAAATSAGGGFLRYLDSDIAALLKDVLRESNVSAREAVISIPAGMSFVTLIPFPRVSRREVEQAIPYEARKYVPIPLSEVVIDWEIVETGEERDTVEAILVAVPKEVIEKFRRVTEESGLKPQALEVETSSILRSLVGNDPTPAIILNIGHLFTAVAITDRGRLRASHTFGRGGLELTRALERGLGVSRERAEELKRDTGLSEKIEEKDIASILQPLVEATLGEAERLIHLYNRKAARKIQKVILAGGGSNLKGLVEQAAIKFGLEVTVGNPFRRVATPAFMQPILRNIGPGFAVATGLALREITVK